MMLKRVYDHSNGKPVVSGVKVLRAKKVQHFTQHMLDGALEEGWLSLGKGKITIDAEGGPVSYAIARSPGIYCCHCDEKLGAPNEGSNPEGATRMRKHVKDNHGDSPSPDPTNPAGYRQDNYYAGVLVGNEQENMSREEANKLDKQVREAVFERMGEKFQTQAGER